MKSVLLVLLVAAVCAVHAYTTEPPASLSASGFPSAFPSNTEVFTGAPAREAVMDASLAPGSRAEDAGVPAAAPGAPSAAAPSAADFPRFAAAPEKEGGSEDDSKRDAPAAAGGAESAGLSAEEAAADDEENGALLRSAIEARAGAAVSAADAKKAEEDAAAAKDASRTELEEVVGALAERDDMAEAAKQPSAPELPAYNDFTPAAIRAAEQEVSSVFSGVLSSVLANVMVRHPELVQQHLDQKEL
eukprot:PLAT9921.1.p2 GENE.PLAT9921.1~~PLAT9921.1.p2  ORF type:complete len:246 (-),score=123.14 PLAT9921.1:62-799(-)